MLPSPRIGGRPPPAALLIAFSLLGCHREADPVAVIPLACDLSAPPELGAATVLPAGADCLSLSTHGRYALAYFDSRYVEGARTAPESLQPDLDDFRVTVGWGGDDRFVVAAPHAAVAVPEPGLRDGADDWVRLGAAVTSEEDDLTGPPGESGSDGTSVPSSLSCDVDPGLELFCRDRPWEVGDTLSLSPPFGALIHEASREVEVLVVRSPFVFAVRRDLPEEARDRLRPILADLAIAGNVRVLPFLRRSFVDAPATTSVGSGQIFVDTSFDDDAVCVCGVAVSTYAQGASVSGISIRIPAGPEFEAHRIGLFAHELAHVWQHMFDTRRVSDPTTSIPPVTRWAVEGGADFVRQEILRGLAEETLDGNRDASVGFANPYQERWIRDLGTASGRIRNGYGQTAGLLRHLFIRALEAGFGYDDALQAVLQGSLEGWFGSPEAAVTGPGVNERFSVGLVEFDPTAAILEYAIATGIDDRLEVSDLRIPAILEAWRESPGSRFLPVTDLRDGEPGRRVRYPAGSLGYAYVNHQRSHGILRLGTSVDGIRWMVVRFE